MTHIVSAQPRVGVHEQLVELHAASRQCLDLAIKDHSLAIGKLLQLDLDIGVWEAKLRLRPEAAMFANARRELGFSIYSAATGLYLQAFSNLRLFLELNYAAVYFSANELLRRRWIGDRADFGWSKALDPKDGVLSPAFVQEFHPTASADAPRFAAAASECYRACSQYIHGKMIATDSLPASLSYSSDVMKTWASMALRSGEAVLYLLYSRYGQELLSVDDGRLSTTLEHWFSHLPAVRQAIEAATAGSSS